MRINKFTYNGVQRIAIEQGPDGRGCGLLHKQLVPEIGFRTFKPEKMMDVQRLGSTLSLFYLTKVKVNEFILHSSKWLLQRRVCTSQPSRCRDLSTGQTTNCDAKSKE